LRRKLRQNKGETLVETLFSLLIAVMSIGLIAASVAAATKISTQLAEMDATYKQDLQEAECHEVTPRDKNLKITFRDEHGIALIDTVTTSVEVYGDADSTFLSYSYGTGGGS